ncbi:hypothetical protein LPB137_11910 [Poseidonibacter parvus]|uniref:Transport permease protein n=1 Tax=Poseidonibacter parvus TaxID=1850254 RepID=A0A1P8KPR3_9BACT|nr:ABC transporter permease [Poseidonibacter parvus]APW66501.1 hypothetical protein LPB137_11910 [Poseidonibacter parvus]
MFFNTNINFFNVIYALFLREIQTRFGSQKMGYFWAVVEPSVQILIFTFIHAAIGTSNSGYDIAVFIAVGFLSYNFFKNIMMMGMSAFDANKALFNYRQVRPIYTIISRILIEFLIFIFVSSFFLLIAWFFHFDFFPENLLNIILLLAWFALFGASLGLLFAIIVSFYETFKKIVNLTTMPLLFTSGLFYSLKDLPQVIIEILLYNPVLHFVEAIHANYINVLDDRYVDYTYMTLWTIVPLFLSLFIYLRSERKIITS